MARTSLHYVHINTTENRIERKFLLFANEMETVVLFCDSIIKVLKVKILSLYFSSSRGQCCNKHCLGFYAVLLYKRLRFVFCLYLVEYPVSVCNQPWLRSDSLWELLIKIHLIDPHLCGEDNTPHQNLEDVWIWLIYTNFGHLGEQINWKYQNKS